MRNRWMFGMLALAVASSLLVGDAWARGPRCRWTPPDPAEIAAKALEQLEKIGDRCADHNAQVAERCVDKITALIMEGDLEGAEMLADRCIGHVNRSSDRCVRLVEGTTGFYVRILEMLEADAATIESVEAAGEAATGVVVQSQEDAVTEIEGALPVE